MLHILPIFHANLRELQLKKYSQYEFLNGELPHQLTSQFMLEASIEI